MLQNKQIIEKLKMLGDTRVLGLMGFGVIALLVTWSGIKVVQTNYELEKKISISRQENAIEKLENENLKLKNAYYETPQFLELSARRQFGKASPGEKLYTVPEEVAARYVVNEPKAEQVQTEGPVPSGVRANLKAWADFLSRDGQN